MVDYACFWYDVDNVGNDLSTTAGVADARACQVLCQGEATCVEWLFVTVKKKLMKTL